MSSLNPLRDRFNRHRSLWIAAHDLMMCALALPLAYWLRLGDGIVTVWDRLAVLTPCFVVLCATLFYAHRIYRMIWRYLGFDDIVTLLRAVTLAVAAAALGLFLYDRLEQTPRSVLMLAWLCLTLLLLGPRLLIRARYDRNFGNSWSRRAKQERIPILLAGAGDNAEAFLRELSRREGEYRAVGLLSEEPQKINRQIHGVRVYGRFDELPHIMKKLGRKSIAPQKLVLTEQPVDYDALRNLAELADREGLAFSRLPHLTNFQQYRGEKLDIRPVPIEDLLGRSQQPLDRDAMAALIAGQRVMITGAGGTIGSELSRQIAALSPTSMLLLDHAEYPLYRIDAELAEAEGASGLDYRAVLADIRDAAAIDRLMAGYKPDLVFHAAAVKHVPLSERNPAAAVLTNVYGTQQLAHACLAHGAKQMVMISTDKAVNPSSLMGTTKRLAEAYCQALGNSAPSSHSGAAATRFTTVRFGNVLGSTGSVVPRFRKQLEKGGPLTVTHPDMVRYFMSVREAVALVLQAAALGGGLSANHRSAVYVLEMGDPVNIRRLAEKMIRLAGLTPYEDIGIVYTGLRPGEKLYEELFYANESRLPTPYAQIHKAESRDIPLAPLEEGISELIRTALEGGEEELRALLCRLVPEYHSATGNEAEEISAHHTHENA